MMLLDTCTLLWLVLEPRSLSSGARAAIRIESLFVAAISAFEVALLKTGKGLRLPLEPEAWYAESLTHHGIAEIPIDGRIAARSALLPSHHRDPADRIIIATAQLHGLTVLTPDPLFRRYRIKTLW